MALSRLLGGQVTPSDFRLAARTLLRNVLDAAIGISAFSLAAVVAFGGFDFGVISASTAAKPALQLILLLPVRLALRGESWLTVRGEAVIGAVARTARVWVIPPAVRDATFAVIITWIPAMAVGFVANILLLPDKPTALYVPLPWPRFAETFAVFDSGWYFDIAKRGYFFDPAGQSSIAFFPLYPLLMRLCAAPFGASDAALWSAGIAISCVAFAMALVSMHGLTERMSGSREIAQRAVLYTAIFPFSFYFSRVYTEALFLLCTVAAVRAGHDLRWVRAGLFGALAAATRPNGVLIVLPLLLMAVSGRPTLRVVSMRLAALAPIPLAVAAYSAYVYTLSGNPLAWLDAQSQWWYSIGHPPHRHLLNSLAWIEAQGLYGWLVASHTAPIDFFYTLVALLFLAVIPFVVRQYGAPLGVYVLVSLAIPLSGNAFLGIGRYASVLFPVFMVTASFKSIRAHQAILVVSALFYALFFVLFIGWFPLH